MKVLLVGGPLDGERVEWLGGEHPASDMRFRDTSATDYTAGIPSVSYFLQPMQFHTGLCWLAISEPNGDVRKAVEKLIERYPTKGER